MRDTERKEEAQLDPLAAEALELARLPPPTDMTKSMSWGRRRLPCSQVTNTLSQPSSLVRAVNSETLSTGV